jgi:hypothetical protein
VLVDHHASLTVELLELVLRADGPLHNVLLETGDGVLGGTHLENLVTGTVGGSGVGHGVTSVSVGDELQNDGSLSGGDVLLGEGGSLLDGEDIHSVDLKTGNVLSTLVVLSQGGGTAGSGTHSVLVVLTSENARNVPELGHVVGLEDLSLVGGSVSVQGEAGVLLSLVLHGESNTGTDGNLGSDNTVSSVEVLSEHVHGSSLSLGDSVLASKKLSDDALDGGTTKVGETVATVGSDDGVLLGDRVLDTGSDSLLSSGKMAETTDLLLLVETVGSKLHTSNPRSILPQKFEREKVIPDGGHVVVHLLHLRLGGLELEGRDIEFVSLERSGVKLDSEGLVVLLFKIVNFCRGCAAVGANVH